MVKFESHFAARLVVLARKREAFLVLVLEQPVRLTKISSTVVLVMSIQAVLSNPSEATASCLCFLSQEFIVRSSSNLAHTCISVQSSCTSLQSFIKIFNCYFFFFGGGGKFDTNVPNRSTI